MRTIVWDLEGVLIVSCNDPVLHSHATTVLERSQQDFERVYLWTRDEIGNAYNALHNCGLVRYFNRLIGTKREGVNSRYLMIGIENNTYSGMGTYLPRGEHQKNLHQLGGKVEDKVLIEDVSELVEESKALVREFFNKHSIEMPESIWKRTSDGYPPERVVRIESYTGDNSHTLLEPYAHALAKFP